MKDNIKIPNLLIVSIDHLILHEVPDNFKLEKLKNKISNSTVLTHPPIVAKAPKSQYYFVLDGANRVTSYKDLGYDCLVVQLVNYNSKDVELKSWNHIVRGLSESEIDKIINFVKSSPYAKLKNKKIIQIRKITLKNLEPQLEFFNELYHMYQNKKFKRIVGNGVNNLKKLYEDLSFLIFYPTLSPKIISAVSNKKLTLPAGITRHIINSRVLNVDFDLKILKSHIEIEEKNKLLKNLVTKRLQDRKIRYYNEPIIILND
ncbi:hypothetical protein KKA15_06955 [Patescibacteria group bacterium]|nr:hypothetical protein [Patescibacteria group bacterium]